jgi:putative SOS response-associated peptidase YedK
MCGRFAASKSGEELQREFQLRVIRAAPKPSFNVAPTMQAPVVVNDGGRALDFFRWGLIPWWAKDPSIGAKTINARADTLAEKPAFRDAFRLRRCLVLADGFFEWKVAAGSKGERVPHFIRLQGGRSMPFAGLWERWRAPEGSEVLTCTIVTTTANELLAPLHDRLPVILGPESVDRWLDPQAHEGPDLLSLLAPCPSGWLEAFPVSSFVNKPDNDGPECIQRVDPPSPAQGSLF